MITRKYIHIGRHEFFVTLRNTYKIFILRFTYQKHINISLILMYFADC